MSDKTFGVKVSEEVYDKVKNMIDASGISAKDWFEKAVALSTVQDLKDGSGDYKQDLSELELHTTRIYELVANMIQRANYLKADAVKVLEEKLESKDLTIAELQGKGKELSEALQQLEGVVKQDQEEKQSLTEQVGGLRSTNENNQALIQEYKEKIDTLSSLVNQYKGYAEENVALKQTFADEKSTMTADFNEKESQLASSIEELKETVKGQKDEIERLKSTVKTTVHEREKETKALQDNHVNELTQLTITKNIEKERAVLEAERKFQEQLQAVHEHYNEKIASLYEKFNPADASKVTKAAEVPKKNK